LADGNRRRLGSARIYRFRISPKQERHNDWRAGARGRAEGEGEVTTDHCLAKQQSFGTATALQDLIKRIGADHVERRLKIETEHEAQLFGQGLIFFNLENWYSAPIIIEIALKLTGLYRRARQNADRVLIRKNTVVSAALPASFDGFTILHMSDLHADISRGAMRHLLGIVGDINYDICVLTGDYRGKTFGPFDKSLEYVDALRARLTPPVYAVLGNHDSIRMTPAMEAMGIRMLFNECEAIVRGDQTIYLAGVDDPHFYRADDIAKAASEIPQDAFSILLSHTPEVYDRAAKAKFDVLLSGHTHGGQLCLPGGIPIKLEAKLPRSMGASAWRYADMAGYTSAGAGTSLLPVRLNCPPEITLHTLRLLK
jgi:predicted MPP superfamily phosphohydrolase